MTHCLKPNINNNFKSNQVIDTISLSENGWIEYNVSFKNDEELLKIASSVGSIQPDLNGILINKIQPKEKGNGTIDSFSFKYGLSSFPYHTDTAYLDRPMGYILFYNETLSKTATNLIFIKNWLKNLSKEELTILKRSIFLLKTPHFQKFTHIISGTNNDLRYDPNVMLPYNSYSKIAAQIISDFIRKENPIKIEWSCHKILIVNNRQILHSRDEVVDNNRILKRIYINELEKK